jgi:hypothetical protein
MRRYIKVLTTPNYTIFIGFCKSWEWPFSVIFNTFRIGQRKDVPFLIQRLGGLAEAREPDVPIAIGNGVLFRNGDSWERPMEYKTKTAFRRFLYEELSKRGRRPSWA